MFASFFLRLKFIDLNVFVNLMKLTILDFSNNDIKIINIKSTQPGGHLLLPQITKLNLFNNKLTNFSMENFPRLEKLNLGSNYLTAIPHNLTGITELNVSNQHGNLKEVPEFYFTR